MKRIFLLILLAGLCLTACSRSDDPASMDQPVYFYYRTATTDFSAEDGVIRAEIRDLGLRSVADLELFEIYFSGPRSSDLVSPISQDTRLTDVRRRGGTLELVLTHDADQHAELDRTLTFACLAKTGLSLDGIHKVRIQVQTEEGYLDEDVTLTDNDILLYDNGDAPKNTQEVALCYADETGSFLLTEKRSVPIMTQQKLAQYLLELLLNPPENSGMCSPLPPGTAVLDVSVKGGVCSVDFNGDFYTNRPGEEQEEHLTILSVVNTLCKLDGINQVQIYCQGRTLSPYVWLNLSEPWMMDSSVEGPIREELGEFAATLCLPSQTDELLHRLTIRTRVRGGASRAEALLLALISRDTQNGLTAPLSGMDAPKSITVKDGVCTVEVETNSLPAELPARRMAIRSITATLTTLPEIDSVSIWDDSGAVISLPQEPQPEWFCVPPEP